jgi:hypothetical protein
MSSTEDKIAALRRLSRDRGATKPEREAAKAKADELEFPGRGLSDFDFEAKIAAARGAATTAEAMAAEAEAKARAAKSESAKLERSRATAADALARLTAEAKLRKELKLRKVSEIDLGEMLASGDAEAKALANAELARRVKLRIAERMRGITLHQLCVIFFEAAKEKGHYGPRWVSTHADDERTAAENEIRRRIKRPEVGAISDHSAAEEEPGGDDE